MTASAEYGQRLFCVLSVWKTESLNPYYSIPFYLYVIECQMGIHSEIPSIT